MFVNSKAGYGKVKPFTNANVIRNTNFRAKWKLVLQNIALIEVETKELISDSYNMEISYLKNQAVEKTPVGRVKLFEKQDSKIPFSLSNFTCFIKSKTLRF